MSNFQPPPRLSLCIFSVLWLIASLWFGASYALAGKILAAVIMGMFGFAAAGLWFQSRVAAWTLIAFAWYAVVEVVHGAQPRYTLNDIVPQIKRAVRYVHANAARFGIDANRIGISGASAGGHLSLMIGGTGDAGNATATDPVEKAASTVNAVGVFMPPTDFLNWGKESYTPFTDPKMAIFMPAFGVTKDTPKEKALEIGKFMSPIVYVSGKFPPTMIVHGDKDDLVPVQQATVMDEALGKNGVDHSLIVVKGGGHDGKTLLEGFPKLVAWFKDKLK